MAEANNPVSRRSHKGLGRGCAPVVVASWAASNSAHFSDILARRHHLLLGLLAILWLGCSPPVTPGPPTPYPTVVPSATATLSPPTPTATPTQAATVTLAATATATPAATAPPTTTAAPTTLNLRAEPNYGTTSLATGFRPDPSIWAITSGGSIAIANLNLGRDCSGFATAAPDLRFNWSGNAARLRFFFVADNGGEDATLVVNDPASAWHCNDDSDGNLNPLVNFANPQSGQYDIWVGSFAAGTFLDGTLYVTELDLGPADYAPGGSTDGLDVSANPNFGTVELASGFSPDPLEVSVVSGGNVDVSGLSLGNDCLGFASRAPDYRLVWSGNASQLRLFFVADNGGEDATLVVNDPSGVWHCSDDSDGSLNPLLTFTNPQPGQYDIWVGSFAADTFISGSLHITERELTPDN